MSSPSSSSSGSNGYAAAAGAIIKKALADNTQKLLATAPSVKAGQDMSAGHEDSQRALAHSTTTFIEDAAVQRNIQQYALMNASQNSNAYITQLADRERTRIERAVVDVQREKYKLRYEILRNDYLRGYYRTATGFVVITTFVTAKLLIIAALWRVGFMSVKVFAVLALLLFLAYLMVAVTVALRLARRRPSAGWNQFNWGVTATMQKELDAQQEDRCPYMSMDTGSATGSATSATSYTCAQASDAYISDTGNNASYLASTDNRGKPIDPPMRAWWHWYVYGSKNGWAWPYGTACRDATTPVDAARMYADRYMSEDQAFGSDATDAYNDYVKNRSMRAEWPGQAPS
jgi:hypothetical protein